MSKSIDIDKAAACVKNIVDINRCGTCDKLDSLRRWSTCGHIVCVDCATREEDCVACLCAPKNYTLDGSLVQKANNALLLLNTFEDTFKTDVYRRHRISEQLKIEKEIFPECIQAPAKYFNKRKSLSSSIANKENRRTSFYLGEEVASLKTGEMEKTKYIQNWLTDVDKNKKVSPRKPFSEIKSIGQNFSRINNKNNVPLTKVNKVKNTEFIVKLPRNQAHKIKRPVSKNKSGFSIKKYLKTAEQENICENKDSLITNINKRDNTIKCEVQDESGIVIDDDCIVLDDSQTTSIDKDALALQAVLEADKKETSDYASLLEDKGDKSGNKNNFIKVPYFLKSPLYKTCRNCRDVLPKRNTTQSTKNVSVTIVYNMTAHKGNNTKQSASVQTEVSEIENSAIPTTSNLSLDIFKNKQDNIQDTDIYSDSQEIFPNIVKNYETDEIPLNNNMSKKSIVIDESDSDLEHESLLHVTAEVHRSCEAEDYGVLCDLPLKDLNERKRHSARGTTPDSTNSSDKENFDPNRMKRFKCDKKHSKKDKLEY